MLPNSKMPMRWFRQCRYWREAGQLLLARALTLVVPRGRGLPDIVTQADQPVAIRVPAHPVAQELLRSCGMPIAAPSANRSTCFVTDAA